MNDIPGYEPQEYSTDNFRRSTMMRVLAHGLFAPIVSRPSVGMLMRTVVDDGDYPHPNAQAHPPRVVVVASCHNPALSKRQKRRWRGKSRALGKLQLTNNLRQ
jgi:hypothetical protein